MARRGGEAGPADAVRDTVLNGEAVGLPLTYLSFDGIGAGVGASQVLPYVLGLADRGLDVTLHSFERGTPAEALSERLVAAGVEWHPHAFRGGGTAGAIARITRAVPWLRGKPLVHARSDLAAASALLARPGAWVWDVRSFWVDQRIALGAVRRGSPVEQVLRRVERGAAERAAGIVTLTDAAVEELGRRHGPGTSARATVISTCVDLDRFSPSPPPPGETVRLLLSGSFNPLYDMPAMLGLNRALGARRPTSLRLARPEGGPWDSTVLAHGGSVGAVRFGEMPAEVQASHAGLSVCRRDEPGAILAAMPTKIAEFLACGRPVVVNRGLGDMDRLAADYRCAVVVDDASGPGLAVAADELLALLDDPGTAARCRRAAEDHFSLVIGVDRLVSLYSSIGADARSARLRRARPPDPS